MGLFSFPRRKLPRLPATPPPHSHSHSHSQKPPVSDCKVPPFLLSPSTNGASFSSEDRHVLLPAVTDTSPSSPISLALPASSPSGMRRLKSVPNLPPPSPTSDWGGSSPLPAGEGLIGGPPRESDHLGRTRSVEPTPCVTNVLGRPFENVRETYSLGRELGRGMSGIIRLCVDLRNAEAMACKIVHKNKMMTKQEAKDLRREIEALELVGDHASIAGLKGTAEDEENVYMFIEYCRGGELFRRIKKCHRYDELDAAVVTAKVASVLSHCRRRGVVHRDLKPENILLASRESNTDVRVVDFGQAAFYAPGDTLKLVTGSAYYIAPEVLQRSYGPECDVWSLGVILYILLSGVPPFWAEDRAGIFEKVQRGRFALEGGVWRGISEGAKDLLRRMLVVDPAARIAPDAIQEHPWIRQYFGPESRPYYDRRFLTLDRTVWSPPLPSRDSRSHASSSGSASSTSSASDCLTVTSSCTAAGKFASARRNWNVVASRSANQATCQLMDGPDASTSSIRKTSNAWKQSSRSTAVNVPATAGDLFQPMGGRQDVAVSSHRRCSTEEINCLTRLTSGSHRGI